MGPRIDAIRSQAINGIAPVVGRFTEVQLRSNSVGDLARYVVDYIMGEPFELGTDRHSYEGRIVPVSELDVPAPNDVESAMDVIRLSLHIPL